MWWLAARLPAELGRGPRTLCSTALEGAGTAGSGPRGGGSGRKPRLQSGLGEHRKAASVAPETAAVRAFHVPPVSESQGGKQHYHSAPQSGGCGRWGLGEPEELLGWREGPWLQRAKIKLFYKVGVWMLWASVDLGSEETRYRAVLTIRKAPVTQRHN